MREVSVCTRCGKRAIHENEIDVEVKIDGVVQDKAYMLCNCSNCGTNYIVEVGAL